MVDKTSASAKQYQAIKNRLFLFSLIVNFIFLVVFMTTGLSQDLKMMFFNFNSVFFIANALYVAVFSFLSACISLPLDFYEGYILEHRFGLSRQTLGAWFKDVLKKSMVSFLVVLIVVEALYFFLLKFSQTWWLWTALFWFFISVVLTRIAPKVLIPLFYKYTPLGEGALRESVMQLLQRFHITLREIFVLDFSKKTVKANACVAGLGRTKQIFLSDTLVNDFSQGEVLAVLAHEMGHYVGRDTLKMSCVSLVSALASCYAASLCLHRLFPLFGLHAISDISGLPVFLIVMMGMGLVLLPLQNYFSRFLEVRADQFALATTKDRTSFISLMRRLGEKNFADFSPSQWIVFFLYDHPPLAQRIHMAEVSLC